MSRGRELPHIIRRRSPLHGWGVFALEPINKNRRIVTYDGDLEYAFAPLSVTLCLEDEIDISRGDFLAHPNNVPRTERSLMRS